MKRPKSVSMPVWKGFRPNERTKSSTGEIEVDFHGSRITPRQLAAVTASVSRAKRMQPKLLAALAQAHPKMKGAAKDHFVLWEILITTDHHLDIAYVAYMFQNSWHPSGDVVLTHGDRVVSVGDFDVLTYPHADPERATPKPKRVTPAKIKALREGAARRAKKNPKSLRDDAETVVFLPSWAGFASDGVRPSNGEVMVSVGGDDPDAEIGPAQKAAFAYLVRHASRIQKSVLDAIAKAHRTELRDLEIASAVELVAIHVRGEAKKGMAIVGYELRCAWDNEHGLGVRVHGDHVLSIGAADEAILG
jgi:hypothetical protein